VTDIEERLLDQIRADPADDRPRMVLADHLSSRGDDRGEYITLALAYARDELRGEPLKRYLELDRRQPEWATALGCEGLQVIGWRRGFPEVVATTASSAAQLAQALRRLPIRDLILRHGGEVAAVARLPELAHLRSLALHGPLLKVDRELIWSEFPPEEVAVLVVSPHWTSLRKVELQDGALTDRVAKVLGAAAWWPQLETFETYRSSISGDGLVAILERTRRLETLRLWNVPAGDDGAIAIDLCELPALTSLAIGEARLTPAGARVLFGSRNLAKLSMLDLRTNDLGGSIETLARSPHLTALHTLDLGMTYLVDADARALAAAHSLTSLVTLALAHNGIEDLGAAALATSHALPKLAHLDLQSNRLTRDGVLPFTTTALPSLATLAISQNPLPSGQTRDEVWYDQGYEVGGATVDIAFTRDEIERWFRDAGSKLRIA
jgi:uncharacterized protein (TIGR02996 family)